MGDRPLDEEFDTQMDVERNPCGAWQAIQAQAAEITSLQARLAAAEKLAEAGQTLRGRFERVMRGRTWSMTAMQVADAWDAALSTFQEGGK